MWECSCFFVFVKKIPSERKKYLQKIRNCANIAINVNRTNANFGEWKEKKMSRRNKNTTKLEIVQTATKLFLENH